MFYNEGRLRVFDGTILWKSAPYITAVLLSDAYTPDVTHSVYADLTGELSTVLPSDYTPKAVTNRNVVRVGTDIRYTSNPIIWGMEVSISAKYLVLLLGEDTSLETSDPLIGYVDFGETRHSINSEFSFSPDNNVWFTVEELNII
jgi:hypothetical protein